MQLAVQFSEFAWSCRRIMLGRLNRHRDIGASVSQRRHSSSFAQSVECNRLYVVIVQLNRSEIENWKNWTILAQLLSRLVTQAVRHPFPPSFTLSVSHFQCLSKIKQSHYSEVSLFPTIFFIQLTEKLSIRKDNLTGYKLFIVFDQKLVKSKSDWVELI